MNPVLKRTLAGISVGALVIGLFVYAPLQAVLPILLVLSSLVQLEFYQMAKAYEPVTWFGLLAGGLWLSAIGFFGFDIGLVYLVIAFPAVLTDEQDIGDAAAPSAHQRLVVLLRNAA